MKKLMVAVFAVAFAAVAQAASVIWGGAVATVDGGDTLPAGTQAALLFSTTAFSAPTSLEAFTVGTEADNGAAVVQTYTLSDDDSINWAFSSVYSTSGSVDGYYGVLVLNDAGDAAAFYALDPISGTTATSSPTDRLVNLDWAGEQYLTQNGYTVSVGEVVPEPTSGLLLLLGVAGLALKRRRA